MSGSGCKKQMAIAYAHTGAVKKAAADERSRITGELTL